MSKRKFFKQFVSNWKKVGSFTPSSRFLTRKMLKPIDFNKKNIVIELGAGTGNMTRALLEKLSSDSELIIFEISANFCQLLKKIDDPRLRIIHDSAENIEKYLDGHKVDYVVSGLPLALFSKKLKKNILNAVQACLKTEGHYIQFQYSPHAYFLLKTYFAKIKLKFTLFNAPPALIYVCQPNSI